MHFKAPLAGLSTILGLAALENCHFFPVDPLSSLYSRKLLCSKAPTLSELLFPQKKHYGMQPLSFVLLLMPLSRDLDDNILLLHGKR